MVTHTIRQEGASLDLHSIIDHLLLDATIDASGEDIHTC
jgi:hypothetical protein